MTDHAYTRAVRELLEATLDPRRGAGARRPDASPQVQDELDLDDMRARVPDWNGPGSQRRGLDLHAAHARRARIHGPARPGRTLSAATALTAGKSPVRGRSPRLDRLAGIARPRRA